MRINLLMYCFFLKKKILGTADIMLQSEMLS